MNMTTPAAATLLALATAVPALAQDQARAGEGASPAEIIVTAQANNASQVTSGGDLGVLGAVDGRDAPFAVRSYNAALILNQQPLTLGAVLENDASVRATYGFGNAAELFLIRGFPLFGDDVGLGGLYGIAPRQLVAPELYENVQLLNGASAFLNGAAPGGSGVGGSVNLTLKRAGDTPLTRASLNFVSRAHFGGSFDVARRFGDGRWGVRINGALRGGDVAVAGEYRKAAVLGAGIDYRGDALRLSLDLAYQEVTVRRLRPKVTLGTLAIPAVPAADANYAQPWTYTRLRDVFGLARIEYDLAPGVLLYATAGARDGSERGLYGGLTVTDAATGAATGTALFVPRTDNNEAVQAGLRAKATTGGIGHTLNLGGALTWQVNRNAYDFRYGPGFAGFPTNLYAPVPAPIPASSFVGGDLDNPYPLARTALASVFASDTLSFSGERALLTLGARWQRIVAKSYSAFGGAETNRYARAAVTPVVGLVVKPSETLSLYANRIEALQQGPQAPADATLANPGEVFAPFKSVQYEVGAKLTLGRLQAGAALFQITQPSAFASPVPGSTLLRFGFGGRQRNRGLELSLVGDAAPGLRVNAGATLTDARLVRTAGGANDGDQAQGIPAATANLGVEWDTPLTGLTLTGRAVVTGRQYVNPANTLRLPGWQRLDLGARYVLTFAERPVTLRAGVDNVANGRYWASAYDSFSTALLQAQPRTVRASASIDF